MKKNNNWCGVSEVIGFVLILAIMITGIGLVTLYGYPILLEQQANANLRNMERDLIVLQTDINSLTFKSVPYKETTMQVNGGTLFITKSDPSDPSQPYFTIQNGVGTYMDIDPMSTDHTKFYPGEIQYQADSNNALIGLQNGAVMIQYFNSGSSMLAEPRWFFDINPTSVPPNQRTLFVPLIKIDSDQTSSLNGFGTVRMEIVGTPTSIEYPADTYRIEYHMGSGNYPDAWRNFFADDKIFPGPNCVPSGQSLTVTTDKLLVKKYSIKI